MRQIFASFFKEWLLLLRDKVGLLFLFLLPMGLVFFNTLAVSENPNKPHQIKLLLLNQDQGSVMQAFVNELKQVKDYHITEVTSQQNFTSESAKLAVSKGQYQALIIIPNTASQDFMRRVTPIGAVRKISLSSANPNVVAIQILVDPTLPAAVKNQISLSIKLLLKNIQTQLLQKTLAQTMHSQQTEFENDPIPVVSFPANPEMNSNIPNDVQQYVPAWALFGMFFIITPLSGGLVKERSLHVLDRLHMAPVSFMNLIVGKIIAFILLNLVQLTLMLVVGVFILPWFGLPALNVRDHLILIFLIGFCASLAATGFGMLVGSFVRTPEQANVIGPFLVVIAAAIGGIFIPIYLLPEAMQKISEFSPLFWAHSAFLDVFMRDASLTQIWHNLAKLVILGLVTTWLALMKISYRPN